VSIISRFQTRQQQYQTGRDGFQPDTCPVYPGMLQPLVIFAIRIESSMFPSFELGLLDSSQGTAFIIRRGTTKQKRLLAQQILDVPLIFLMLFPVGEFCCRPSKSCEDLQAIAKED
jgi:hypothetical protein